MTTTQSRAGRPLLELESFDELTKGVAAGTISRRKALALAGGAALSAALVPFAAPAEAGRRRRNRCRNKPLICRSGMKEESICDRPVNSERICVCMKREPDGRKVCVNISGEACRKEHECDHSRDCSGNQVCVSLAGPNCCSAGSRKRACVRPCPRNAKRGRGKGGQTALLR